MLVAAWLYGIAAAPTAAAHTELRSADPKDGAHLKSVPDAVELTFSEAVHPHGLRVTAGGEPLTVTVPPARPAHAVVDLGTAKPAGSRLTLNWRVVDEEDGHAMSGHITYRMAKAAAPTRSGVVPEPSDAAREASPAVKHALVAARWAGYLSLALFVGGLAFLAMLWPQGATDVGTRRVLALSWAGGLVATVAQAGLQGAHVAAGTPGDALTPAAFSEVLDSEAGVVLAARALLWLLGAVVLASVLQGGERAARSPSWRVGMAAVSLALLRATGMAGHNAEGSHPGWGGPADLVHLAGISLWIGGLVLLVVGVLPRRRSEELAAVVPRYSLLAFTSVTAIAVTGAVLTWQVVGSFGALLHTSYGHLLLVKLAILALVLAAAQRSRTWVRNRLDLAVLRCDAATVRPLIRSVALEACLVLAVLAATSLLVTANPGR